MPGHSDQQANGIATARNGDTPPDVGSWRSVDWRSHQQWVTVEGRAVNTIQLGAGPPLVFVHGLSGSWPNWLEQMAVFAPERRVLALDLPGFGHSPGDAGDISMPGYARLLSTLLEQLGLERAAVVGNSMGGLIAAELAASFPEQVERLVLVSPAGLSTYANRLTTRAMPAVRRLQQVLALGAAWTASNSDSIATRPRMRELALKGVVAHPSRLPAPLAAEQIRGAGTDGFMGALEAILEFDLADRLPLIKCPSLVVWGTKDRLITVRDADRFAELIPGARKVVYEDTGHMAMLEQPERFNPLLREFLAE
ncbi:MAG TPA: alpha/beta hydrolase [Solirubrobacteraceae bacterium]|jgi:pimeloyl-ACP methyl ester carboxylesterase|nr:alpha/beta hydrolase [Solirubrobacteraceae bacterium]